MRTVRAPLPRVQGGRTAYLLVLRSLIGNAIKYQARIIQVFRRLHTAQRYPGTGIRLALVKRIVELRGGSVGVDETPGLGSKFWFTIATSGMT